MHRRRSLLALERLECRLTPACPITTSGRQLLIRCDDAADRVTLNHSGQNTLVTVNTMQTQSFADSSFDVIQLTLAGGNDTAIVLANTRPVNVNGGTGQNTVNLGDPTTSMEQIRAAVSVRSQGGSAALIANDALNRTPRSVVLNAQNLSGLAPAPISFLGAELSSLTLRGGSGGNLFTVQSPPRVTTLFAGAGSDTVRVQALATAGPLTVLPENGVNNVVDVGSATNMLDALDGALTVRGQNGRDDRLRVHDQGTQAGQNYTLSARTLTRPGMGTLTYENVDTLDVFASAGPDRFTVTGTADGTETGVHGGPGDDQFIVGTPNISPDGIDGRLRFTGGPGVNRFFLIDSAARTGQSYTVETIAPIDTSEIVRSGSEPLLIQGVSFWFFTNSNGDDQVQIASIPANVIASFDFGPGNDLLIGQNIPNAWTFSGLGSGSVNGNLLFTDLENAAGGYAEDSFNFGNGLSNQGLIGYLDGGLGYNTLDYSGWTSGVYVDLYSFVAMGTGAVFTIHKVVGGSGDDYFHGDGADNWLVGNTGRDILVGDEGGDYLQGGNDRDMLFGGGGPDWLEGGPEEDLLIDGYTSWDYDVTALSDIWNEWTRLGVVYADRISNLRNGTGLSAYLLTTTTVFSDGLFEYLYGEGDLDWFWADGFEAWDRVDPDEVVN